ncbi:hypothetical protein L1887_31407 [Cichorium endivia]|nr:hypothetical protein L1887_31407 [Cichorium endivia]
MSSDLRSYDFEFVELLKDHLNSFPTFRFHIIHDLYEGFMDIDEKLNVMLVDSLPKLTKRFLKNLLLDDQVTCHTIDGMESWSTINVKKRAIKIYLLNEVNAKEQKPPPVFAVLLSHIDEPPILSSTRFLLFPTKRNREIVIPVETSIAPINSNYTQDILRYSILIWHYQKPIS